MSQRILLCSTILAATLAQPALAAPAPKPVFGDPVKVGDGFSIDPIIDARLRYENVDQPTIGADAVTLRLRAGIEVRHTSGFAALVEGEGTLAIGTHYNAFGFATTSGQRRTAYAVVADPENVELNRAQLQYKSKRFTLTVGRQRINLDDVRWVGNAGWRQNEQTFDAVRAEATLGPVSLDGTYSISQRTVLGVDGGPRTKYKGDFVFLGAGYKIGPVNLKAFAYLLDYDPTAQAGALATANADTQTYGARATGSFPLSKKAKLNLMASYARQSSYKDNPASYGVDYLTGEAGVAYGPFGAVAGYEKLGSDGVHAVQTPMATLHKWDGWADVLTTTPGTGIQDYYGGVTWKFAHVKALPGLNAAVTYHQFDSDKGALHYGNEWDASLGFKIRRANLLAKYASYSADKFGVNTKKFWLQLEVAY